MRKRNNAVLIRLTNDELGHFRKIVKRSGFSREAYLRSLINGLQPTDKPPPDYHAMMRELHAIGNNLNQIAYVANAKGVVDAESYARQAAKLSAAIAEIVKAVKMPTKL